MTAARLRALSSPGGGQEMKEGGIRLTLCVKLFEHRKFHCVGRFDDEACRSLDVSFVDIVFHHDRDHSPHRDPERHVFRITHIGRLMTCVQKALCEPINCFPILLVLVEQCGGGVGRNGRH